VALDERWFIHAADPSLALTRPAEEATEGGLQALTSQVDGLVVVTQTCDIVRDCVSREFVEICPLLPVDDETLKTIRRGQRPNWAFVPALAARRLVADLDRVMTVEKSVVAGWARSPGWTTDAEARAFAQALARKRVRAAFPDDFTAMVKTLLSRMIDKHGKDSPEGRALRALSEIRILASPEWEGTSVEVMFWFIREEDLPSFDGKGWDELVGAWLALVHPVGRFTKVFGEVTTLARVTAEDYVNSDRLDLDHLSSGK
jgi:hypothetical protein